MNIRKTMSSLFLDIPRRLWISLFQSLISELFLQSFWFYFSYDGGRLDTWNLVPKVLGFFPPNVFPFGIVKRGVHAALIAVQCGSFSRRTYLSMYPFTSFSEKCHHTFPIVTLGNFIRSSHPIVCSSSLTTHMHFFLKYMETFPGHSLYFLLIT